MDKIGWVQIVDRRLLVGRNRNAHRFSLPGGGREPGETDVQTLVREASEVLGVRLDPSAARHVGTELARVTTADGDLVTDAERQLMATLVERNLID